jgi:DNA polymerase III delta prime subunit
MVENLTEKYRPKTFDEIIGNRDNIEQIRNLCRRPKGAVPCILLTGAAGLGKTSATHCFIRERLLWRAQNSESYRYDFGNFEEYNNSDYRGIDFVREKIKPITKLKAEIIVYLNEADRLTPEAQDAMKSILENKGNAIFILDGNKEEYLTEPTKSRCVHFRFKPLSVPEIYNRLLYIIKAEGIQVNTQIHDTVKELAVQAKGDMRTAINSLEAIIID